MGNFKNIDKKLVERNLKYQLSQLDIEKFSVNYGVDTLIIDLEFERPSKSDGGIKSKLKKAVQNALPNIVGEVSISRFESSMNDDDGYKFTSKIVVTPKMEYKERLERLREKSFREASENQVNAIRDYLEDKYGSIEKAEKAYDKDYRKVAVDVSNKFGGMRESKVTDILELIFY